jgi:glycerophosphoryl diester phosphodiesterase
LAGKTSLVIVNKLGFVLNKWLVLPRLSNFVQFHWSPYTMRDEERHLYLVDGKPESAEEEYRQLIELGADGLFTDFPATGVAVVDSLASEFVRSPI